MAVRECPSAMPRLRSELDQVFEEFGTLFPALPVFRPWKATGFMPEDGRLMPVIDFYEQGNTLIVEAEVPGISKENLAVGCTDHTLTIQGEIKREEEETRDGYFRAERRYGTFYRAVALHQDVDFGKARAQFENGVLRVTLPKALRSETAPHTIPVT